MDIISETLRNVYLFSILFFLINYVISNSRRKGTEEELRKSEEGFEDSIKFTSLNREWIEKMLDYTETHKILWYLFIAIIAFIPIVNLFIGLTYFKENFIDKN